MKTKKEKAKLYCNKCGKEVRKSNNPNYKYQCDNCDEDLFAFETHTKSRLSN